MESGIVPQFPRVDQASDTDQWHFWSGLIYGRAASIAFTGFLAATAVLIRACCRQNVTAAKITERPLIILTGLTWALTTSGALTYGILGAPGLSLAGSDLVDVTNDIASARRQGSILAALGQELAAVVGAVVATCPEAAKLQSSVAAHKHATDAFVLDLTDALTNLVTVSTSLDNVRQSAWVSAAVPAACSLLYALAVLALLRRTRYPKDDLLTKLLAWRPRLLGGMLVASCILVISCSGALGTAVALTTASLCRDVDANSANYLVLLGGDGFRPVGLPFIAGTSGNHYLDELNQVRDSTADIRAGYKAASTACLDEQALALCERLASAAEQPIGLAAELLASERIHTKYQSAMHQGTCSWLLRGIVGCSMLQVFVGLVCLPALAAGVESFVSGSTPLLACSRDAVDLAEDPHSAGFCEVELAASSLERRNAGDRDL